MRMLVAVLALALVAVPVVSAQTKKTPPKKTTPATKPAAKKAPPAATMSRAQAEVTCPSELGVGVKSKRRFCDVLAGRDPAGGMLVTIPPHRGPVTLSFELHNRHT